MPRVARIVTPGVPHDVTQPGNNRQEASFTDDDRALYLALLQKHAREFGLRILSAIRDTIRDCLAFLASEDLGGEGIESRRSPQ